MIGRLVETNGMGEMVNKATSYYLLFPTIKTHSHTIIHLQMNKCIVVLIILQTTWYNSIMDNIYKIYTTASSPQKTSPFQASAWGIKFAAYWGSGFLTGGKFGEQGSVCQRLCLCLKCMD